MQQSSNLHLSSNRDLNFNTSLDVDDDLLDDLGRCVEINQTLVNSHLEAIPGLGTFTTRSLSGCDLQGLGWKTDWALDSEILGLGTLDQFLTDFLEGGDIATGERDADLVGFWALAKLFFGFLE